MSFWAAPVVDVWVYGPAHPIPDSMRLCLCILSSFSYHPCQVSRTKARQPWQHLDGQCVPFELLAMWLADAIVPSGILGHMMTAEVTCLCGLELSCFLAIHTLASQSSLNCLSGTRCPGMWHMKQVSLLSYVYYQEMNVSFSFSWALSHVIISIDGW